MEIIKNLERHVLLTIFKEIYITHTITSLSNKLNASRVGLWKVLKRMEIEKLILLKKIGGGKTNMYIIKINWNKLTEKKLELYLIEESFKYKRWLSSFEYLEKSVDFLILYGSILHHIVGANDIDILGVVSNEKNFIKIQKIISTIQKSQIKRIHSINFTIRELKDELINNNKAFLDAIKNGIVLYGQEKFVKFIKEIHNG